MAKAKKDPKAERELPLRSAMWIPFEDIFEDIYQRLGDVEAALLEYNSIAPREKFAEWIDDRPVERLLKDTEIVVPRLSCVLVGLRKKLKSDWRSWLLFYIDGQERLGQLYDWAPDLEQYFSDTVDETASALAEQPETPERPGRHPSPYWEEVHAEIVRRLWKDGKVIQPRSMDKLALDLVEWASRKWDKGPQRTQMQEHLKWTIAILKLVSRP